MAGCNGTASVARPVTVAERLFETTLSGGQQNRSLNLAGLRATAPSALRIRADDPHSEDGRRRSAVGAFEPHRDLLLIRRKIRGNRVLGIEETDLLLGTPPQSRLLPDLPAVHQHVARARAAILVAVSNDQLQ